MYKIMEFFLLLEMPRTGGFKVATLWTQVDQNIQKNANCKSFRYREVKEVSLETERERKRVHGCKIIMKKKNRESLRV